MEKDWGLWSPKYYTLEEMEAALDQAEEAMANTKKTGTFEGKSNALGQGGRAAQLKAQGVPGAVIGEIARSKGAAPGGPNYKGGKKGK